MLPYPKCFTQKCRKKSLILTECRYCLKKYCLKHRFPESHQCTDYETGRLKDREIFSEKLISLKCEEEKINKI